MSWFRLYDDMPLDPKVRFFTPSEKWAWVCLLCAVSRAKQNGEYVLAPCMPGSCSVLAKDAELKTKTIQSMMQKAIKLGMVEEKDGVFSVLKWGKRQYKSDVSTDRVRTFRKQKRNVSETHQSTETETEKRHTCETGYGEAFEEWWKIYPRRVGKQAANRQWVARLKDGHSPDEISQGTSRYAAYIKALDTEPEYIKLPSTFLGRDLWFTEDWKALKKEGVKVNW